VTAHRTRACLENLQRFFTGNSGILEWGVAPARPTPNSDKLRAWVDQGRNAAMDYMSARLSERENPKAFHPWAESVVMFAFPYGNVLGLTGKYYQVASYAGADDYHSIARKLLREAEAFLRQGSGLADIKFYGFVDTAPVFERDLASEAGIGWRGKNCCTLNRTHGSAFHLAGFFIDIPLAPSAPVEDFCGGCTRCLDACPTQAFTGPGQLDASKCISYWTIEAKGEVPQDLSEKFGGWIFGCDVCQEVCPWNHKPLRKVGRGDHTGIRGAVTGRSDRAPEDGPDWLTLLRKGGGFQSQYKNSPLTRAGRKALMRNLAIAARNLGDTSMIEPFREALPEESDPVVRAEIERTIKFLKDY
jgi:epoxyqueuosine reductase